MADGAAYLIRQQNKDGGWSVGEGSATPAITAMVLKALVQHPDYGPDHPAVKKGYEVLLSYKQPDGGIYNPKEGVVAYTSAVALMTLAAAKDPKYDKDIKDLVAYLKSLQIQPGANSADGSNALAGGVSYGPRGRPDLTNVGMWMEALHDAGVKGDDPAMQRAVAFVSRLQNSSETNKLAWAAKGTNDGGFVYVMPGADPGRGKGPGRQRGDRGNGRRPRGGMRGGIRTYGSLTYTGFKSLLYANVDRNDPRVKAAFSWIRRYWRLDGNPNMPMEQSHQGLYYYYHVFAKALRAWGLPVVTDAKKAKHNWREELIDALAARVNEDGSWVNKASSRWWEGNPVLTTCYAVLALQEAIR
ncbi:MAG: terpene cyclase/mutase family protein [Phycisphaerae bacterium]|nr:terpene cyclase/mutase family protein [Phycisphaerae bacterium]